MATGTDCWPDRGRYLVLRNVMDAQWLQQANDAVEWSMAQPPDSEHAIPPAAGRPHGQTGNWLQPLALPQPHCLPFRKMVAWPVILEVCETPYKTHCAHCMISEFFVFWILLQRIDWILGSGFVHYGSAPVRLADKGGGGRESSSRPSSVLFRRLSARALHTRALAAV